MMDGMKIERLNPGGSNSYLLKGNDGYLMVDAGMKGAASKVKHQLAGLGINPGDIKHILITHDHYDHTGGLSELRELTGAKVLIHGEELKDNSGYTNQSSGFYRVLVKVVGMLTPEGKPDEKHKADIIIENDMDLHSLGYPARIICTPGHSPGSVCLITDDRQCLAGDTLFNMFPGSHYPIIVYDRKKLAASYKRLEKEDCLIYFPGHGESISKDMFVKRILKKEKIMRE